MSDFPANLIENVLGAAPTAAGGKTDLFPSLTSGSYITQSTPTAAPVTVASSETLLDKFLNFDKWVTPYLPIPQSAKDAATAADTTTQTAAHTDITALVESWFGRIAIIVLGLVFVAAGLSMFKPIQAIASVVPK